MEMTFDIYKRETTKYIVLRIFVLIGFFFLIFGWLFSSIAFFIPDSVLFFFIIVWLLLIIYNGVARGFAKDVYLKDCDLILSDDRITVQNSIYLLDDLIRIEADVYSYKGRRTRTAIEAGLGNRLRVNTKTILSKEFKFVIQSPSDRDKLKELLKIWVAKGHIVILNGLELT